MPPIEETEKHLKTNNDYLQQGLRRQYPLKSKELGLNYVQEGDESKDGLKVQRMSLKLYLNDG